MSNVSYAPPGESAADLWLEKSSLDGSVLAGVSYGVHFTLYLFAMWLLLNQWNRRKEWFLITFTTVMFILGTIFIGANTKMNELSFVDNRNFPGGPSAYLAADYNSTPNLLGNTMFVLANWLADSLLMYRCLLIYNFRYWIVLLPGPVYLASIAMGILVLFETNLPASNLWTALSVKFALSYFSLSLSLNLLLTLLIVVRLLVHRHQTQMHMGTKHATHYTSIAAMLIESSALYSTFSVIFIVSYARNSPVQNLFLPVLGEVQMISPLLIVIRVALGRGWLKNTADTLVTRVDASMRNPSTGTTAVSRICPSEYPLSPIGTVGTGSNKTVYSADTVLTISGHRDKKVSSF